MKHTLIFSTFLLGLALISFPSTTEAQLRWRISVKFILDNNGKLPAYCGSSNPHDEVKDQIDLANQILDKLGRGYRLQLTEIVDLRGVSDWFNSDIDDKDDLEKEALANPLQYQWRNNAINVYINNDDDSGISSFPGKGNITILGRNPRKTTLFHEVGHFFNLYHTHQTGDSCGPEGDDCVADTIKDNKDWKKRQNIVDGNPGANAAQVDAVWFNIMSYHSTRNRLTSDQLDRLTDASNGTRSHVATGKTIFVDGNGVANGSPGSSTNPYRSVQEGVSIANNGDIILVRTGIYNERLTINKPVTLRASRGDVVIGRTVFGLVEDDIPELWIPPEFPDTFDNRTGP